uniref:Chloride intracellular channel protein 3 n=1 Tax=Callorhinchus milii TaxID=7868 RepID=V9L0C3_CALMI|eukprot:gi/632964745/ref/XP_007898546.1/ PREDICTED: chloride intracellular channel protein 3 [Callorhinchus milii]
MSLGVDPKIQLFIKASDDGASIGNCPFSQRLFMILWLKGIPFTINTVDMKRDTSMLKDIAPGCQPPFILFNGDLKTDTNKIEEFLEEVLVPPRCPHLGVRYHKSSVAGDNIFQKFSAYIKSPTEQNRNIEKAFLKTLVQLDEYLKTPLEHEEQTIPSKRRFLDGNDLTLADCNLLPKLNIVRVVCMHYRRFKIPEELSGLCQYLSNADSREEFFNTCPNKEEIIMAYSQVAK